jgi:hypothetical protein
MMRSFVLKLAMTCMLMPVVLSLSAQSTVIKGIVLDAFTKKPIASASVYINNTQVATITDENGVFNLQNIITHDNDVVISHVAYQKLQQQVDASNNQQTFLMQPRTKTLDDVSVKSKNPETWKKWHKLFEDFFIGSSGFNGKTIILNPQVLRFSYNKQLQRLKVIAHEPILVKNEALGYIIHFNADSITYSFQTKNAYYSATYFFENIDTTNTHQYAANRLIAYKGSKMHYMRSLYNGNAEKKGFYTYVFKAKTNEEKKRLQQMIAAAEAKYYQRNIVPETISIKELTTNRDTAIYYTRLLEQPSYVFYDSIKIETKERISFAERNTKLLTFNNDTLLVMYNGKPPANYDEDDLVSDKATGKLSQKHLPASYSFFNDYNAAGKQYSILSLSKLNAINIERTGRVQQGGNLFADGYMTWTRLAYLLPWDYDPAADVVKTKK